MACRGSHAEHPRDGPLLHGVDAPITISPLLIEIDLHGHYRQAHAAARRDRACVLARALLWHQRQSEVHALVFICRRRWATLVLLASITEAMIHMVSLATIRSGVRIFTEAVLSRKQTLCWRSLGSTPTLVMLQLRGFAKRRRRLDPAQSIEVAGLSGDGQIRKAGVRVVHA